MNTDGEWKTRGAKRPAETEAGPEAGPEEKRPATGAADFDTVPSAATLQGDIDTTVQKIGEHAKYRAETEARLHAAEQAVCEALAANKEEMARTWSTMVDAYQFVIDKETKSEARLRHALLELYAKRNCRVVLNRIRRRPNPAPLGAMEQVAEPAVAVASAGFVDATESGPPPDEDETQVMSAYARTSDDEGAHFRWGRMSSQGTPATATPALFETQPLDPSQTQTQTPTPTPA